MRDIKFRGRVLDSNKIDGGKIVCGMLSICTLKDKTHWIYPLDGGWGFEVDPDSVAQLIGYDSNGKEVYEGDIVERGGKKFIATLEAAYHAAD